MIFRDGDETPIYNYGLTQRTIGTQSANAGHGSGTVSDILSTASAPDKALQPRTAVIVHGAIIVGGPLWVRQTNGTYELLGWGFAINQSSGAPTSGGVSAWRLFGDDANEAQPYVPRGLYWCMSAAPVYQRTANPMSCSICCTNYYVQGPDGRTGRDRPGLLLPHLPLDRRRHVDRRRGVVHRQGDVVRHPPRIHAVLRRDLPQDQPRP